MTLFFYLSFVFIQFPNHEEPGVSLMRDEYAYKDTMETQALNNTYFQPL